MILQYYGCAMDAENGKSMLLLPFLFSYVILCQPAQVVNVRTFPQYGGNLSLCSFCLLPSVSPHAVDVSYEITAADKIRKDILCVDGDRTGIE